MIAFIEENRDIGVEPICKHLPIAPSTFYDHMAKRANPDLLSDRAKRDIALKPEIERVWEQNYKVYGVRKVWHQMRREGFDIARCTVARLMNDMGIEGVIRGKKPKTTIPDGGVRQIRTSLAKGSDAAPYTTPRQRHSARASSRFCLKVARDERLRSMLKWLVTEAWTAANFCRLRMRRNRSMARSRRRKEVVRFV